tara:strand:+ start:644 stop:1240 length:597 start_codon:yes stop_codon:yes gene_type:complete
MKAKKFEYIKGPTKTTTPWFRPDPELLNLWKEDFFKIPHVNKYKYWIYGGSLEDWQTWDIDIVMIGASSDYEEVENILIASTQLGFKYRQLIDINWVDYKTSHELLDYWHTNYILGNIKTINKTVVSMYKDIIKNGEAISNEAMVQNPFKKIHTSLWARKQASPGPKQVERIKKGSLYKCTPVLLTAELDFKDIIDWP